MFRVAFRLTSLSPLVINVWLEPFNPHKTVLPMIATCSDNLIAALADMPTAPGVEIQPRDVLQERLQALQRVTIRLRPGDTHRYPVLALLYRLPDLRPGPRSALLHHIHSNIDLFKEKTENYHSSETAAPPPSAPVPDPASPHLPARPDPARQRPTADSAPLPGAVPFLAAPPREDLFDRFLSWIASLVS